MTEHARVNAVRTRLSGGYKARMGLLFGLMALLSLPIAMAARRNGHWLFWFAGLSPLAFGALIMVPEYRRSPRVFDDDGVERRDGRRLRWDDFVEQRTITIRRPGASVGLSHTELRFRSGVVKIFPVMFDDLDGIHRFLAQRGTPPAGPAVPNTRARAHASPATGGQS